MKILFKQLKQKVSSPLRDESSEYINPLPGEMRVPVIDDGESECKEEVFSSFLYYVDSHTEKRNSVRYLKDWHLQQRFFWPIVRFSLSRSLMS